MSILVCAATRTEAQAVAQGIRQAGLSDRFEVFLTGVGPAHAKHRLSARLKTQSKPRLIISTGFAGALSGSLPVLSWITARQIFSSQASRRNASLGDILLVEDATPCSVLSTDELALQTDELMARYISLPPPLVVDMESATIAKIAYSHAIPCSVLRLITDTPSQRLPLFVSTMTASLSATQPWLKAKLGLRAMIEASRNLRGAMRLASQGWQWRDSLKAGWSYYAGKVDEIGDHHLKS